MLLSILILPIISPLVKSLVNAQSILSAPYSRRTQSLCALLSYDFTPFSIISNSRQAAAEHDLCGTGQRKNPTARSVVIGTRELAIEGRSDT